MTVAPYEKDKPIYYEFTACPAAEFAIRNGLTDIMPALCNVDYAAMELIHAKLVRTDDLRKRLQMRLYHLRRPRRISVSCIPNTATRPDTAGSVAAFCVRQR